MSNCVGDFKQERLEYLAFVLAEHCHINVPCILGSVSTCPFGHTSCEDITPKNWYDYMRGLEVSEL